MGRWLTDNSRLEKSNKPNRWFLLDNELYQDDDGSIYLAPRNYETDNYSIPDWVAWIAGNKSKYDPRPAHIHDFGCQYHQLLKLKINEAGLRRLRLLRVHKAKLICEDIPTKYLCLVPVTKWEIDCMFKRMMKATKTIPPKAYNTYRCGVFLNTGWSKYKCYDMNKIYQREVNEPPKY
ncbi:MAG: DUF1353 domain-containing protein [Clostridia bacterium]|nr:DUF1353 domain-containing protein [Clostridia bacterium]